MCETFGVLPEPGGLFDQQGSTVLRLDYLLDARVVAETRTTNREAARQRLESKMKGTRDGG